jgi:peptidoglycan/LPS O-acetylase OafA/YrhL
LCLVLRGRLPRIAAWQRMALIFLGFALWFYSCFELHTRFDSTGIQNPGAWPLIFGYALASLGCVILLVAFLGADQKLFPPWAVYLGRISFGLYVFHEFAIYTTGHFIIDYVATLKNPIMASLKAPILLLTDVLTLGLTILMAALSYRYLETPFLKLKKRHTAIESQPIAGAN